MPRYLVHGYYTDEPQVCIDVVDADTDEAAEVLIQDGALAPTAARCEEALRCPEVNPA